MPKYVFFSEETVSHKHELDIELPVDMGDSTIRLTDRMARTVAEQGAIDGLAPGEKVVAVFRGDEKIWPRAHKSRKTAAQVTFNGDPANGILPELHEEEE